MNDAKYIGLDVHQATISAVVLDSTGRPVMESILETKAATILQFIDGLCGSLHVTFEEGTCASWLHDLLKPHVTKVLVCDSTTGGLSMLSIPGARRLMSPMNLRRLTDPQNLHSKSSFTTPSLGPSSTPSRVRCPRSFSIRSERNLQWIISSSPS
jgi:hypothetical protein